MEFKVGNIIYAYRKSRRLTQEKLAEISRNEGLLAMEDACDDLQSCCCACGNKTVKYINVKNSIDLDLTPYGMINTM